MNVKQKIINFWYYHKQHTLFAIIGVVILSIGIISVVKKEDFDVNIMYATHGYSDTHIQTKQLSELFSKYANDVNADGKQNVQIITINYGSSIEENRSASAIRSANLASGKSVLFLLDEQNYNELKSAGFLADISELGNSPYLTSDAFEIYKSGLLDSVLQFKEMDDNYYLCVRVFDEKKAAKDKEYKQNYEAAITLVKNIVEKAS